MVSGASTCASTDSKEGTAYAIDVDPEDGEIEWVITLEDMPGGNVFILSFSSSEK